MDAFCAPMVILINLMISRIISIKRKAAGLMAAIGFEFSAEFLDCLFLYP